MFDFRKHLLGIAGAVALALGAAAPGSAAVQGTIPGGASNEALPALFGTNTRNGWYNATLYLIGGPSDILVEYLGSEAGFQNNFTFSNAIFNTPGTGPAGVFGNPIGSATVLNVASGVLGFSFSTPNGTVTNGDANDGANNTPNFFVSFANENAGSGQIAYLFLDDSGAGPDDNHDDMVIRLTLTSGTFVIPLPAAAWLMLAGLGGLGLMSRRRSAA